jgi:hypothetical protein
MRLVHILRNLHSYDESMCGYGVDKFYLDPDIHGWCSAKQMHQYRDEADWKFCKFCLESAEYALYLLADVP